MGEVNLVLTILLVEGLLLAGLAAAVFVYHGRLHRGAAKGAGSRDALPCLLQRAVAATQSALHSRGVLAGADARNQNALRLRLQVLELEQRLADPARRGEDYWGSVCEGYAALAGLLAAPAEAGAAQAAACAPGVDAEGEARELTEQIELQQQTLDRLSAALAGLIEDPEAHWRQEAEIQSLREGTRKLGQGLEVLSDESRFLAQRLDELEGTGQSPPAMAAGS